MIGYLVRRILQLLPVLLIASVLVWGMIYAVPGSPGLRPAANGGADLTPQ